jgi:hypothetical protein
MPDLGAGAVSLKGREGRTIRRRHYYAHLATRPIGATITRSAAFLNGITLATSRANETAGRSGGAR